MLLGVGVAVSGPQDSDYGPAMAAYLQYCRLQPFMEPDHQLGRDPLQHPRQHKQHQHNHRHHRTDEFTSSGECCEEHQGSLPSFAARNQFGFNGGQGPVPGMGRSSLGLGNHCCCPSTGGSSGLGDPFSSSQSSGLGDPFSPGGAQQLATLMGLLMSLLSSLMSQMQGQNGMSPYGSPYGSQNGSPYGTSPLGASQLGANPFSPLGGLPGFGGANPLQMGGPGGQGGGGAHQLQKGQTYVTRGGATISWQDDTVQVHENGGGSRTLGACGCGQQAQPRDWQVWGDPNIQNPDGSQGEFSRPNGMFTLEDGTRVVIQSSGPDETTQAVTVFDPGAQLGGFDPNQTTNYGNGLSGQFRDLGSVAQTLGAPGFTSPFGTNLAHGSLIFVGAAA